MIEEATVDAYDETEQATGWFTMLEDHLELPFVTVLLGVPVRVIRIDQRDDDRLVAICARGNDEQAIGLADLPLPICRCPREQSGSRPTVDGSGDDDGDESRSPSRAWTSGSPTQIDATLARSIRAAQQETR